MTVGADLIRRLPKAELHVHLDGSLRPETMIELAAAHGVRLPTADPDALAEYMQVRDARNLEEYLGRYEVTLAVMQTPEALERIAYEFVVDAAADGVRYVEARYCPALHWPALSRAASVESPLAGLARGAAETGTIARLIVCGLRTLPPAVSVELAELAVGYRDRGVVAFDLAGAEAGHPPEDHAAAFDVARAGGLALTCHAGEAAGPESIRAALDRCHAQRLGHGVRLREDAGLLERVRAAGIPLEMCPTSNVHTRTVADLAAHPIREYFDRGLVVTVNTDSRLIDRITLSEEVRRVCEQFAFTRDELNRLMLNAFECAFLESDAKAPLLADVRRALREAA